MVRGQLVQVNFTALHSHWTHRLALEVHIHPVQWKHTQKRTSVFGIWSLTVTALLKLIKLQIFIFILDTTTTKTYCYEQRGVCI